MAGIAAPPDAREICGCAGLHLVEPVLVGRGQVVGVVGREPEVDVLDGAEHLVERLLGLAELRRRVVAVARRRAVAGLAVVVQSPAATWAAVHFGAQFIEPEVSRMTKR